MTSVSVFCLVINVLFSGDSGFFFFFIYLYIYMRNIFLV